MSLSPVPYTASIPRRLVVASRAPRGLSARQSEMALQRRTFVEPESLNLERAVEVNTWVYRCCRLIASNIGSARLQVVAIDPDGTEQPDQSETAKQILALIEHPNSMMSGNDLIEAVAFWMNVRQGLLWMQYPEKTDPAKAGAPANLVLLPAHRTSGIVNPTTGGIAAWKVRETGAVIPAWQVIRLAFYNPRDPLRGLSPTSVAFQAADTDYATELCNANIFDNGMRLSGVVTLKQDVGEERMRRIQDTIDAFTGLGNAHAIGMIPSEAEFVSLQHQVKDMDFKNLGEANRDKILGAYGVPRFMLGIPDDSNRASARESRRSFWQDTLIPQMRDIEDKLSVQYVARFGNPKLRLRFDLDHIEALAEDRTEFAEALFSVSTALKDLLDIGLLSTEEGRDILRQRFDLELSEELPEADEEDDEPEPPMPQPSKPEEEGLRVLRALRQVKNAALNRARQGLGPLPVARIERLLRHGGGKSREVVRRAAVRLHSEFSTLAGEPDKLAAYFDGLEQRLPVQ